jgi:hypothetical protein
MKLPIFWKSKERTRFESGPIETRPLQFEVLKDMVAESADFTELPGIGKELAAKIHEILETGTAKALIKLQERIPKTVLEILRLPNLGPKRVSRPEDRKSGSAVAGCPGRTHSRS